LPSLLLIPASHKIAQILSSASRPFFLGKQEGFLAPSGYIILFFSEKGRLQQEGMASFFLFMKQGMVSFARMHC